MSPRPFSLEMQSFSEEITRDIDAIHRECTMEVFESVTVGSPLTGAPGQPVRTGALLASWRWGFMARGLSSVWTEGIPYALSIENGIGPYGPLTLRSAVGGFGSVGLTCANFDRIVDAVVARHGRAA